MARKQPGTVKGADVTVGQVIKIDGRWCRIAEFHAPPSGSTGYRYATVAAPNHDPRLALTASRVGRSVTGRWRMVDDERDYLTREQAAPRWEHVDREIDRADGITTPCAVCAVQARLKNFAPFWAGRGADWPTTLVGDEQPRRVHRSCASDAQYLARVVAEGGLDVGPDGIGRWTSNGQAVPDDSAALLARLGLAPGLDLAATAAVRDAETAEFLAAYRAAVHARTPAQAAEHEAELAAAFGPGETIVDVITGQVTRT
jgi:hypothetical protein